MGRKFTLSIAIVALITTLLGGSDHGMVRIPGDYWMLVPGVEVHYGCNFNDGSCFDGGAL
ncbi:hypothetical protein GCM10007939_05390 [Amylibacter marinus]|uniref:Uncharacterized protein n=1 Tax=Amylibacter marinus TaxID=1475483 RepID=A0ABQ5VSJ0_9RHOB|nr:hypothetical protein GCM10007939_05390 [Amylibacter marinus]